MTTLKMTKELVLQDIEMQESYVTFEGMYTFCLIGCFLIAAFVIVLNLVIWFYDKIFKD